MGSCRLRTGLGSRASLPQSLKRCARGRACWTWSSTLDFAAVDECPFATALQALELQARDAAFTLPSTDAPVQVMSVAEAEGSFFDAVVFLSATDVNWPAVERVNPLLSWTLQRTLKMPGSDPGSDCGAEQSDDRGGAGLLRAGDVYVCEGRCEREVASVAAAECVGSSARRCGRVGPLRIFDGGDLFETVIDEGELPALPSREVGGGASVLKLQAACGFLAFAELRLRARAPESGELGLDAGESGSLLHRALQAFWRETRTQDALRAMSAAERDEAVMRAVDAAFPRRLQVRNGWDRAYLWIQKQRLRSLLRQWLADELSRGPFAVSDVERKELVDVGPLTLDVRVDRIDSVDGGVFLVDYKTGYEVGVKQWAGPRPDDPQLPLYALLAESEELKGVAFGRVRAGREM